MPDAVLDLPRKTRELMNHHMHSTYWNDFKFRDDDVIVGTYAKSGTTWTQQIVAQIIFQADPDVSVAEISPWWDMTIIPPEVRQMVEAQTHRRIIKTHLPADALVMSPKAKYVYVARDGRDVVWSMYNHHTGFKDETYEMFNGRDDLVGPPMPRPDPDIRSYYRTWLEKDGWPFWSFWENTASWWALRDQPNVKLIHFANLKADLEGEMRKIAAFLGVELAENVWPKAVEHCTFDYMKAHAAQFAPLGGMPWEGGADTFINKGVNGRWRDVLSAGESAAYETMAVEKLGADCARWLATGEGL
ncbi:MAG: sulfotransferase domain-containing protein [Phenylobacterium sp.]|uniref:sulfotransferase domain-containing protein n=1 Tax=Phenylobacterium sp. TaxID=1871053 RepID=UPI0025EE97C3|nr:sulfotransferase domain-containing protein [Phenylobacterium sp.]MBI1199026.1 sulfotransferase domain-containing protein [Phenylobacterium sp.]